MNGENLLNRSISEQFALAFMACFCVVALVNYIQKVIETRSFVLDSKEINSILLKALLFSGLIIGVLAIRRFVFFKPQD